MHARHPEVSEISPQDLAKMVMRLFKQEARENSFEDSSDYTPWLIGAALPLYYWGDEDQAFELIDIFLRDSELPAEDKDNFLRRFQQTLPLSFDESKTDKYNKYLELATDN